jgi:hypothetical protein
MKKVLILSSLLLSLSALANENVDEFAATPDMEQPNIPHHNLAKTVLKAVETYTQSQEKVNLAEQKISVAKENAVKAQEKAIKAQEALNALYDACAFVVKNVPAPVMPEPASEIQAHAIPQEPVSQEPAAPIADLPNDNL